MQYIHMLWVITPQLNSRPSCTTSREEVRRRRPLANHSFPQPCSLEISSSCPLEREGAETGETLEMRLGFPSKKKLKWARAYKIVKFNTGFIARQSKSLKYKNFHFTFSRQHSLDIYLLPQWSGVTCKSLTWHVSTVYQSLVLCMKNYMYMLL